MEIDITESVITKEIDITESDINSAMVPGLVLFKVTKIRRKKDQIHGFYIQIKNFLMTFPENIS